MRVAVLALQGAFIEHEAMLASLGVETLEIRQKKDLLASFDGLVIPGGESTVQGKLMRELGLFDPIREKIKAGLPVFGTCAGLILLADRILNDDRRYLATMDIEVVRNGYGRQSGSFNAQEEFAGIGRIPMTFIRAPYIEQITAPDVEVLATVDGHIVAARQRNMLATSFHPELNNDPRIHRWFLEHLVSAGL